MAKDKNDKSKQDQALRAAKKASKGGVQAKWGKQQLIGLGFIVFMSGVGFMSFVFTVLDFVRGNGIQTLDFQDTANLKTVLFGGDPWLIYCVNDETINQRVPEVLEESARGLSSSLGLKIGTLQCWEQTSSGRSVAERFKLKLKPPLAFLVANGNKPRVLNMVGISTQEDIEKKVKPALTLEIRRIDTLKSWPSACTSRRSCVVVGYKKTAQRDLALNVIRPLHEKHRSLKIVSLDTSFWQLKLEDSILATRKTKGGTADVLCLTRQDAVGGKNTTYGGFFLDSLSSSTAPGFLQACSEHTGAVEMGSVARIKARPTKPKKAEPAPPPVYRQSKPSPPPPPKKTSAKVDSVGSREALESEDEPLFEAIDESEEDMGEEEEEEEQPEDQVEL